MPRAHTESPGTIVMTNHMRVPSSGHIYKWKLYGKIESTVVLQIWRPMANANKRFQLIGQNAITTKADRVTFVTVPLAARIGVQKGDLVGLYFTPGKVSDIVTFLSCKHVMYVFRGKYAIAIKLELKKDGIVLEV